DLRRAQRLAASQEKSHVNGRMEQSRAKCSTPRGITGKIAPRVRTGKRLVETCSTPRGITGKIGVSWEWLVEPHKQCSTPRGITGKIAYKFMYCEVHKSRAQRLAASQEKSPLFAVVVLEGALCSTPRRITGKIAPSRS